MQTAAQCMLLLCECAKKTKRGKRVIHLCGIAEHLAWCIAGETHLALNEIVWNC